MPGATLPNMSIIVPLVGSDAGDWDDEINAAFEIIDEHDHAPGSGAQIPTVAININADLAFNGYGIENVDEVAFVGKADPENNLALYVDSDDNELYFVANDGTHVKITSNHGLNLSQIGGIVGDYAAVGAEVAYDDGNDRYTFKQQGAPKTWARIASGDVRLYETGTNENLYVGLKAPGALAASWDITWPLAAPAADAILMMDASGNITAQTSPVLANNANITLQGTGILKHGDRYTQQAFDPLLQSNPVTYTTNLSGTGDIGVVVPASTTVYVPIKGIREGERLKSVTVYGVGQLSGAPTNATYDVVQQNALTGVLASLTAGPTASAATGVTLALNGGGWSVLRHGILYLKVTTPAAVTWGFYGLSSNLDRP